MTSPFGTKFNPFSSSFRSQLNEVGSHAMDWGMNGDDIKRRIAENFPDLGGVCSRDCCICDGVSRARPERDFRRNDVESGFCKTVEHGGD